MPPHPPHFIKIHVIDWLDWWQHTTPCGTVFVVLLEMERDTTSLQLNGPAVTHVWRRTRRGWRTLLLWMPNQLLSRRFYRCEKENEQQLFYLLVVLVDLCVTEGKWRCRIRSAAARWVQRGVLRPSCFWCSTLKRPFMVYSRCFCTLSIHIHEASALLGA